MRPEIRIYDTYDNGCMVDYKGCTYKVWNDWYAGEMNVYDTSTNKSVGYSLTRVASFDRQCGAKAFESDSFINTFISNILFEDTKYLGLKRVFDRRGDEICWGERYEILPNWKGVYYKDGKYIYIKTNKDGHVTETLTFDSEQVMLDVVKRKVKEDAISQIPFTKKSKEKIDLDKVYDVGKDITDSGLKILNAGLVAGTIAIGAVVAGAAYLLGKHDDK